MKKKRILVIGLGRFGTELARCLFDAGQDVMVLDQDTDAVETIKDRTSVAYIGDTRDSATLESIGAKDVDMAIVTFGEDFEATVLAVASLKKLGISQIVARASTSRQAEVLEAVGAHRTIQLEADMGRRLASEVVTPTNEALVELAQGYQVVPWEASGPLVGKTIGDSSLYERFEISIIGLAVGSDSRRGRRPRIRFPPSDYVIRSGDTLMLVGDEDSLAAFADELAE